MIDRHFYLFDEAIGRLGIDAETLRQAVAVGRIKPFICFHGEYAEPYDPEVPPEAGSDRFSSWRKTAQGIGYAYVLNGWMQPLTQSAKLAGQARQFKGAVVRPADVSVTPSDWFVVYATPLLTECWFLDADLDALAGRESLAPTKWPWGDHETKLLQDLAAAAKEWWSTYDPDQPGTAPTKKEVCDWLVKERRVSPRKADLMASILRADGLKSGPRPKS